MVPNFLLACLALNEPCIRCVSLSLVIRILTKAITLNPKPYTLVVILENLKGTLLKYETHAWSPS